MGACTSQRIAGLAALACALGVWPAAAAHFVTFAASLAAGLCYRNKPDFLTDDERYSSNSEAINQTTLRRDFALRVATNTMLYSSFAGYRLPQRMRAKPQCRSPHSRKRSSTLYSTVRRTRPNFTSSFFFSM